MRVLERCIPSAAPEVKVQIDALRQAFSNDTSQAFELKPDLGLRSPSVESKPTPPAVYNQALPAPTNHPTWSHLHDPLSSKTLSPASEYASSPSSAFPPPAAAQQPYTTAAFPVQSQQTYTPHPPLPQISTAPTAYPLEPVLSPDHPQPQPQPPVWDPSGIFSQWNTAFGAPPPPQPPDPRLQQQPQQPPTSAPVYAAPPPQQQQQQQMSGAALPTVTPVMWQNAFTDAYVSGHGHKRFRDEGGEGYAGFAKRRG